MKKILFIVFLLSQMILVAQNNFMLKGKAGNYNAPATIYLVYVQSGKSVTDSAVLKNGEYEFKGNVQDPVRANLSLYLEGRQAGAKLKPGNILQIFLEPGTIKMTSKDSLKFATFSEGKVNQANMMLKESLKTYNEKLANYQALVRNATTDQQKDEEFRASAKMLYAEMIQIQKETLSRFIKENPDSWLSLDALNTIGGSQPVLTEVEPLYNGLSVNVKGTVTGKKYAALIITLKSVAIGAIAPDFTQNTPEGKPVKLSDFRGKYLLLDFWASWCGPCRAENPNVVKAYNQYKDKNFTILSVSLDREDAKDAWLKAIAADNLTWNHVSDLKYWYNAVAVQYGIHAIPDNFLISPEGKIIARGLRGDALAKKLTELLN